MCSKEYRYTKLIFRGYFDKFISNLFENKNLPADVGRIDPFLVARDFLSIVLHSYYIIRRRKKYLAIAYVAEINDKLSFLPDY